MSAPVSAMITSATVVLTPGMLGQQFPDGAKGFDHHLDPGGQVVDRTGVLIDQVQVQLGEEGVVLGEPAGQGLHATADTRLASSGGNQQTPWLAGASHVESLHRRRRADLASPQQPPRA